MKQVRIDLYFNTFILNSLGLFSLISWEDGLFRENKGNDRCDLILIQCKHARQKESSVCLCQ